jgi:hypothetical protein
MLPQLFFYLWARRVGKYILGKKFSGPTQRRDMGGLGEGGAGANPRPFLEGQATRGRSPSQGRAPG